MDVAETAAKENRLIRADESRMLASVRVDGARRGGYILADSFAPRIILIAGSDEIEIALLAQKSLLELDVQSRVVAMPCPRLFDCQTAAYRYSVLPKHVRCIAVGAGPTRGWWKYVGLGGAVVGSPPAEGADPANRSARAKRVVEIAIFLINTEE